MEKIELKVPEDSSGLRIDVFVSLNTGYSRTMAQKLLASNNIKTDGQTTDKSYRVKAGQKVEIEPLPPVEPDIKPQDIPLDIYYEDDDLIVVNKPKGMVVHPADGTPDNTLVNALLYHCGDTLSGIGGEKRPGIVHRIDKDTSGLLVAAKNDYTHIGLSGQFREHSVTRVYTGIVYGNIKENSGDIDAPIGRSRTDRKKFRVTYTNSKPAFTHYDVIERLNGFTLINARLKTGRTHQIRVHMSSIHHPLAGDPLYGPREVIRELEGQALHRGILGFIHPVRGKYMEFSSPPCPQFSRFYEKIRVKN